MDAYFELAPIYPRRGFEAFCRAEKVFRLKGCMVAITSMRRKLDEKNKSMRRPGWRKRRFRGYEELETFFVGYPIRSETSHSTNYYFWRTSQFYFRALFPLCINL